MPRWRGSRPALRSLVLASAPGTGGYRGRAARRSLTSADARRAFHGRLHPEPRRVGRRHRAPHLAVPQGEPRHGIERLVRACGSATRTAPTSTGVPDQRHHGSSPSGAPAHVSVSDRRRARGSGWATRSRPSPAPQSYVVRYHLAPWSTGSPTTPSSTGTYVHRATPGSTQMSARPSPARAQRPRPSASTASAARRRAAPRTRSGAQFAHPDLQPGQGVSVLVSLPPDCLRGLTPSCARETVSASPVGS